MNNVRIVLMSIAVLLLCACSTVKPWQKQYLAKPEMGFSADPGDSRITEHIYTSREAASGGSGVGGGGCGCN